MTDKPDYTPAPANTSGAARPLHQATPPGMMEAAARSRIAAFLAAHPDWDGVICHPADVTHWAQISAGEIVSFQSYLTGRIATLLGAPTTFDATALADTLSRPERLATHLRSAELSGHQATLAHLIGAELAATKPYWLGQNIALIGSSPLCDVYARALGAQGLPVTRG